jgi:hypothetical protein
LETEEVRRVLEIAFVVLAVCLVFGRASGYGFVNCDDYDYALKYGEVTGGITAAGAKWALGCVSEAIWMPLTWVSYMVDFDLARALGLLDTSADGWGVAGVMHAHSVLLHAANAVLVFLLFVRVGGGASGGRALPTGGVGGALVAALLWAVHPLRTESVAWVASRKDVLSLFWELLALHAWLGAGRSDGSAKPQRSTVVLGYALAAVFFLLAACAKPSAMTFPLLAMILDRFVLSRWAGWLAYAPFLAAGALVGGVAAWAQQAGGAMEAMSVVPFWWRALNAMAAFGIYAWHEVFPEGLAVQCLARWPAMPRFLVPGVCVSLAAAWCVARRFGRSGMRPSRDLSFAALLWWCVALVPFLGLAGFGIHAFADRFTYVPAVGLGFVVVWAMGRFNARGRRAAMAVGWMLCVACGCLAWRQTGFWRDDGALYARTLEVDGGGNGEAHVSLGMWAWEFPHDLPLAIRHLRAGWETDAERAGRAGHLLVMALCERGEFKEASEALARLGEWSERRAALHRLTSGGRSRSTLNYQVARAYYLSCQDETRGEAAAICERLEEMRPAHPDVLYLRQRLANLAGDGKAVREVRQKLAGLTGEYIHYRFLGRPWDGDAPGRREGETT